MMWIRTPSGKRINLAALAYVEPYTSDKGNAAVKVAWRAAGTSLDGDTGGHDLIFDYFHGDDAAALLARIDMIAGVSV